MVELMLFRAVSVALLILANGFFVAAMGSQLEGGDRLVCPGESYGVAPFARRGGEGPPFIFVCASDSVRSEPR
jgi:hypothetical protein